MAILNFLGGQFRAIDGQGNPISQAKVFFYEPGTSTKKDTYQDSDLLVANTNPVVCDTGGLASIWLNGNYKVVVKSNDELTTYYTEDNINPDPTTTTSSYNLQTNGSFETDSNGDGKPDDWVITTYPDNGNGAGTQVLDSADQRHGGKSIKFTSLGDGGGYCISENYMTCSPETPIVVQFSLKSSVADVRNFVRLAFYDENKTAISNATVYDDSTTNPTSWMDKYTIIETPSNARFVKLEMYGCHNSDTTPGSTWFDNVVVRHVNIIRDTVYLDDDGAAAGPLHVLRRKSASPADSDLLGEYYWEAEDSAGNLTNTQAIGCKWSDVTDGTEDTIAYIKTLVNGVLADRIYVGNGLYAPGETDQGAGSINFTSILRGGNQVYPAATDAETRTGTATDKAITPANYGNCTLGWNQTWQAVTRSGGTVYQNTTGRPIVLAFYGNNSANNNIQLQMGTTSSVADITLRSYASTNEIAFMSAIVPDDWYYKITDVSGSRSGTYELR